MLDFFKDFLPKSKTCLHELKNPHYFEYFIVKIYILYIRLQWDWNWSY